MFDKLKELWEMKTKAEEIKKELETMVFTAEDKYSVVRVKGTFEVVSVSIKSELNQTNLKEIERSIVDNINKALREAQFESAKRMLTKGL